MQTWSFKKDVDKHAEIWATSNGDEDCTHKSETKDTTQGIHDIVHKRKFTNIGKKTSRVNVITMIRASEGGIEWVADKKVRIEEVSLRQGRRGWIQLVHTVDANYFPSSSTLHQSLLRSPLLSWYAKLACDVLLVKDTSLKLKWHSNFVSPICWWW